jgi:hypothetical protein
MDVNIDQVFALLGEKTMRERLLENELNRYAAEINRLELELQKAVLPDNVTVEQVS